MKNLTTRKQIIHWAESKGINDPIKQTLKTVSEVGELADHIAASGGELTEKIKDDIGDIEVCLTILKHQLGLKQNEPIQYAYDHIKNRTGKTVNGVFVKD